MNEELYNDSYLNKSTEFINYIKQKSHNLLPLNNAANLSILEIGCGNGYDVIELAKKNPSSHITGIDIDVELIQASRKNAEKSGCSNITFILSDVEKMPFEQNNFDIIRAERVFQHLKNPSAALQEINRVLKSKGTLSIVETDWAGMNIYAGNYGIEKKINETLTEYVLANGNASRNLISYFKQISITSIAFHVFPIVIDSYAVGNELIKFDHIIDVAFRKNTLSEAEKNVWRENTDFLNKQGSFNLTLNVVICSGTKS